MEVVEPELLTLSGLQLLVFQKRSVALRVPCPVVYTFGFLWRSCSFVWHWNLSSLNVFLVVQGFPVSSFVFDPSVTKCFPVSSMIFGPSATKMSLDYSWLINPSVSKGFPVTRWFPGINPSLVFQGFPEIHYVVPPALDVIDGGRVVGRAHVHEAVDDVVGVEAAAGQAVVVQAAVSQAVDGSNSTLVVLVDG